MTTWSGGGKTRSLVVTSIAFAVAAALFLSHPAPAAAAVCPGSMEGAGTSVAPCLVTTELQLAAINDGLALHYRLANDITLSAPWAPIAEFTAPGSRGFSGSLDGNGNTISGLQTVDADAIAVGLFGITSGAVIQELRLASVNVTGAAVVGALAGVADATQINEVSVSGSVHAEGGAAGGLIGYNFGFGSSRGPTRMQQVAAQDIDVTTGASSDAAGGLVGLAIDPVAISDSFVGGSVSARDLVGGLGGGGAGGANMSVANSLSTAELTVAAGRTKAGLVPNGVGPAVRSYFDSAAAGTTESGILGGEAKSSTQLKQLSTYSGWDIGSGWDPVADVWGICQTPNTLTLPFLNWTVASSPCTPAPPPSAPTVTTGAASSIFANGATLRATVNANNGSTSALAIYTTSSAANAAARIGTSHATTPSSVDGADDTSVQSSVTGLQPNTTYYYWISATNTEGTNVGSVQTFPTIDGPPPLFPCTSYQWPGGRGTTADPYLIDDYVDLYQATQCPTASFRQRANVSLTEIDEWIPIGDLSDPFTGTYDGGRYQITDLSYSSVTGDYVGLFGVTNGATIRNINALTGTVLGRTSVGGLVGRATNTTVTDVHTSVTVTGDPSSPAAGSSAAYYIGGLVGWMNGGTITGSSSSAQVTATEDGASTGNFVGGLVGYATDVAISDSWASGNVFGIMDTGGLIGLLLGTSTLTRSNATGNVGGTGTGTAGGLIGSVDGTPTITDVFATGSVTSTRGGVSTGGLVGFVRSGAITRAYSTGAISATGASVSAGGLIGAIPTSGTLPTFAASLWDTQTSGIADATGAGALSGVTSETTVQMQTLSTFIDEGWDISATCDMTATTVWALCSTQNGGYPLLPRAPAPEPTPEPSPNPSPSQPNSQASGQQPSIDIPGGETSTDDSATSSAPPPIAPPRTLRPGRTFATMDGEPIRLTAATATNKNSMSLAGPGFTTDFGGVFRPASRAGSDAVRPVLLPGRTVRVDGSGALPRSVVAIYLFSDPTTLTKVTADVTGTFQGEFRLPVRTPKGNHALQVALDTGKVVNASIGVSVAKTAARTSTTVVRFSGSDASLSRKDRSALRAFARLLGRDRNVNVTCDAMFGRSLSSHTKLQRAEARSARVCNFLASQPIRDLNSLRTTVSSSQPGPAGAVRVVATSNISSAHPAGVSRAS